MRFKPIAFLLGFTAFLSLSLISMENAKGSYERQALLSLCTIYEEHLSESLGCWVMQEFHTFLKTDKFFHVRERKRQIQWMKRTIILSNGDWPHKIMRYLSMNMAPFNSKQSMQFNRQCQYFLGNAASNLLENDTISSDDECVFCFTNKKDIEAEPCGHSICCSSCYSANKNDLAQCPYCRQQCVSFKKYR